MLSNKGTQTLWTPRLTLRKYTQADARQMFDSWAGDPEVTKFLRWEAHREVGQTQRVLEEWERKYESESTYLWGIVERETGVLIGSISAHPAEEDLRAEVGYCLGQAFWGRGFMTEALSAVIRFLLLEVGFNRVEAYHSVNNPASGRVMRKAGMRFEGRMRQKYLSRLGFEDSDMYAVLQSDLKGCE